MHAVTIFLIAASGALYALGVSRLWRRAGVGRGIGLADVACVAAGFAALAFALLSPLHHLADERLWAHMVQHEILMVVAAPLFVVARPLGALAWVLPVRLPRWLSDPWIAFALHAAAIWLWHIPGVFELSVKNAAAHFGQHASFFVTALMFWHGAFTRTGAGVASLFATMLHTGALGALMALSARPWYAGYGLEDQQLAGLVMWVPAGLAYPIAAMALLSRTLRRCAT
jgi:putative membrane protein